MTPDHPNGVAATVEPTLAATAPQAIAESLQRHKQTAQESLGIPPGTGLWGPFLVAGVFMLFLLAILTAWPYALARLESDAARDEKAAPAANEKTEPPTTAPSPAVATTSPSPDAKQTAAKVPAKGDIIEKLGENTSKTAKPNVNPLDKKDDDLLKDIK